MDRELSYRDLIRSGLASRRDEYNHTRKNGIEAMCAFDDESGQFLMVRVGWDGKRRVRQIVLHVRLQDEKIWIETDDTEDGFTTDLLRAGVPPCDIVLAFHPEHLRQYTEFAVA